MPRTSLAEYPCSIARTLDVIGDQWSFLIVRDALVGETTFSGFQKSLGVSKNILSQRLDHLVTHEILRKFPVSENARRNSYQLTSKGRELFPIVIAMLQWGDKWMFGSEGEPVQVLDKENHAPVQKVGVVARDGRFLQPQDVDYNPVRTNARTRR